MTPAPFSIQRLDHIKVSVPDRHEAARWYEAVFGLKILHGPAWDAAASLPDGPLFVGVDATLEGTKVALLVGEPLGKHPPIGLTRASFGVTAELFLRLLDRLDELALFDETGARVTRDHLVDQWIAWSLYFSDPYGNRYELLTYDYEVVKQQVRDATP
jgi:catechol 2,3-dioxygenase-like lactoylglutathione lyase family enzyme